MPDAYTSQFSGEEIDAALRAAQIISGADTPAELRKKLEIRGDTIPVSATDPTPVSEALTASGGGINPNLLDNWFFGNPVNQRGQVEYTENGYIIDRWKSGVKKAFVANKYITLQSNGTYSQIFQPFELQLAGKVVTMSALINTHSGHNVGMLLYDYANDKSYSPDFIVATTANQWMVVSTSFRVADNAPDKLNLIFYPDRTEAGDQTVDILAAKLELGSTQTLAHKEGDKWVLNEIPDYGDQLRRCQRYYFVTNANHFFSGWCTTMEKFWTHISTPVPMRAIPAISVIKPGNIIFGTSGANFATSANQYEIENADATGIKMAVNIAGLTLGAGILCDGKFAFSADL